MIHFSTKDSKMRDNGSFRDTKMGFSGHLKESFRYIQPHVYEMTLCIFSRISIDMWRLGGLLFFYSCCCWAGKCVQHQAGDITRAPLFRFPFFPLILAARFPRERI